MEIWGSKFCKFQRTSFNNLLDLAEIKSQGTEAVFFGADKGEVKPGRVEYYGRSLPLEKALHPDTILAWEINNEPLPHDHGYPLRLVVPGWYGVASVKWLNRINIQSIPFEGYSQIDTYWYKLSPDADSGELVNDIRIRSLIAYPLDGQVVSLQKIEIKGNAWSSAEKISKVEVSFDGGNSWAQADLIKNKSIYGPTVWKINWKPIKKGNYFLMVKATSENGTTQPTSPFWNEGGYGNNFIHKIKVKID